MPRGAALIAVAVALVTAGCASLTLAPLDGARTVAVNGGVLELSVRGTGTPAIIFESGACASCLMGGWRRVIDELDGEATLVAYNRPGYGRSRVAGSLDDPRQIVETLRRGLDAAGVRPPYVLVGHSLGGLYMNLFARLHPDEVAGMVLVDSSHQNQFDQLREDKPLRHAMLVSSYAKGLPQRRYELANMNRFRQEIDAAGPFPEVPLVVLTASRTPFLQSASDYDSWLGLQEDLARLSPGSRRLIVESSGHFIHASEPGLVARAIRDVLALVREE